MLAYILSLNDSSPTGPSFRERFLRQPPNDIHVTLAAQLKYVNVLAIAANAVKGQADLTVVLKQPTSPPQSTTKRASTPNKDGLCWYHAKFGRTIGLLTHGLETSRPATSSGKCDWSQEPPSLRLGSLCRPPFPRRFGSGGQRFSRFSTWPLDGSTRRLSQCC